MPLHRRPLLVALLLLAGCGGEGDGADDFKGSFADVRGEARAYADDVARAFVAAGPGGDAVLAPRMSRLADRAGRLQARVDELDPPDPRREQVQTLAGSLDRMGRDLADAARALERFSPGEWVAARNRASTALAALRAAAKP